MTIDKPTTNLEQNSYSLEPRVPLPHSHWRMLPRHLRGELARTNLGLDGEFRSLGAAVDSVTCGQRLDRYLSEQFAFLSRSAWQHRIDEGNVVVNGHQVKPSFKLGEGDHIAFFHPNSAEPEVDRRIRVIWQDGPVMAVYKPGNLPMHENGPYRHNTFAAILESDISPDFAAIHRLDRETSGIVLCAAGLEARQRLSNDWASRRVQKEYLAIVKGVPEMDYWEAHGAIGNLVESQIRIKKWVISEDEGGQSASTAFETLGRSAHHALVRALPKTGRTNQIRIHLAHDHLPIVGDKLYHEDEAVFLEYFEHGNTEAVQNLAGFKRLCLHATQLRFKHPVSNEMIEVQCPMPPDMVDLWSELVHNEG